MNEPRQHRPKKRLHGWKQIAAACECSQNTAKKYANAETPPLPVHKLGGRYYAYESEIRAWRRERETAGGLEGAHAATAPKARSRSLKSLRSPAVLLLLAGLLIWLVARFTPDRPASTAIPGSSRTTRVVAFAPVAPMGVHALDGNGEVLWTLQGVSPRAIKLARLTKDGPLAIIAGPITNEERVEETRRLQILDPATGGVRSYIELVPGDSLFKGFSSRYAVGGIQAADLDGDGIDELLVRYLHQPNFPAYTVLYEPRIKRSRVVFASTGHHYFRGAHDLDGDGVRELIFEGINNLISWYTAVAAVKVTPPVNQRPGDWGVVASSPNHDFQQGAPWRALSWYALAPPSGCEGACLEIDDENELLRFAGSRPFELTFEGFAPDSPSRLSPREREQERRAAHDALREATRLIGAGRFTDALDKSNEAVAAVREAGTPWLLEWALRMKARALIRVGQYGEAEALVSELQAAHPEIAGQLVFDGAVALHLSGALERAVEWYRRCSGPGATIDGAGRPSYEPLRGLVFALLELARPDEARAAVANVEDRLGPDSWVPILVAYLRWRAAEPAAIPLTERKVSHPDLARYWSLEMRRDHEAAEGLLEEIRDEWDRASSETRPLIRSLEGEVLAELGRRSEATALVADACDTVFGNLGRSIVARAHWRLIRDRCCALNGSHCPEATAP